MASSGGHWVKGIAGPMAGVMVFVPAHPGQITSFVAGEAILQKADSMGITNVGPSAGGMIDQANVAFGKKPPDSQLKDKVTATVAKATATATPTGQLPKAEPASAVGDSSYGLSKPTHKIYGAKYTPSPHFSNLANKTAVSVDSSYFTFPGQKAVNTLTGVKVGSGLSVVFSNKSGNYHIVNNLGKPLTTHKSSIQAIMKGIDMADALYKAQSKPVGQATLW